MNQYPAVASRPTRFWLGTVGAMLLLAPLPIGLRTAGLTALALAGVCLLLAGSQLGTSRLRIPGVFLGIVLAGTAVAWIRGDTIVPFQFLRATVFPCLLLWLLHERISPCFLDGLERLLPFLVAGAGISLLLYFGFESSLYNSTLDIPYESAVYKRLYVFPTYFFLILLFDAARSNRYTQFLYAIVLAVSGSKLLMACIVAICGYFGLRKATRGRLIQLLAGGVILLGIAHLGGFFDRVADLLARGDPWRIQEPLAAARRLADPLRFLVGNGGGVAYWEGQRALASIQGSDSRAFINTMFDVHNGYMTLALRFGVPMALLYIALMVRSVPRVDGRWLLVAVLLGNILLSHGPVETVEAVGLALGIRLLAHRVERSHDGSLGRQAVLLKVPDPHQVLDDVLATLRIDGAQPAMVRSRLRGISSGLKSMRVAIVLVRSVAMVVDVMRAVSSAQHVVVREFWNIPLLFMAPFLFLWRRKILWNVNHNLRAGSGAFPLALSVAARLGFRFLFFDGSVAVAGFPGHVQRAFLTPLFPAFARQPVERTGRNEVRVSLVGDMREEKVISGDLEQIVGDLCEIPGVHVNIGVRHGLLPGLKLPPAVVLSDTSTRAQYLDLLQQSDILVVLARRDAYYFRHSGTVLDAISCGAWPVVPAYPVFEVQVGVPACVGSTYDATSGIVDAVKGAMTSLESGSEGRAAYFAGRRSANLQLLAPEDGKT